VPRCCDTRYHATPRAGGLTDSVGHRVEEGAAYRCRARGLGHGSVEQVVHPRQDQEEDGEVEVAGCGGHCGRRSRHEPGCRQNVSRDPHSLEGLADRPRRAVDPPRQRPSNMKTPPAQPSLLIVQQRGSALVWAPSPFAHTLLVPVTVASRIPNRTIATPFAERTLHICPAWSLFRVIRPETGLWPIRIGEVMPVVADRARFPAAPPTSPSPPPGLPSARSRGSRPIRALGRGVWWFVAPPRAASQRSAAGTRPRT